MRRSRAFSPANIALFCTIFIHITDFLNADSDIVDPCKRQPFRGRCPPTKDNRQTRSQFVLRYYLRSGECVSYPYGYCANDENEPRLFRYKEECEDACLNEATENTVSTSFGLNNAVGLLNVGHDGSQPTVPSEHEEIEETTQHQETYGTNAPLKHDEYQTPKTECQRQRERATGGLIKGGFVPECTQTGAFKPLQCEPDEKTCFCVNSDGIELKNSRCQPGEPKPDCEKISSATPMRTNECTGGAESGPCRAPSQRWFYDEASQECRSFMYSGCGGNGNNYASEEACHRRCVNEDDSQKCAGGVSALRNSQTGNTVDCAKTDCPTGYKCNIIQESHHICCPDVEKSIDAGILHSGLKPTRCEQSKDRGPCDKYELRFYYDTTSNACKYFFYGGCEGNENNFKQIDECEQLCGPVEKTSSSATQSNSITTTSHSPTPSETTESESTRQQTIFSTVVIPEKETQGSENTQSTSMASSSPSTTESTNVAETSQATVDAKKPSTSFEIAMEIATEKTTTEAPATETRSSPTRPQPTLPSQETIRTKPPTTTVPLPANSCQHPLDRGQCGGQFVRWWWNAESRFCETFMYTGCGGNGNNFASREECLGRCHKEAVKPIVAQDVDLSRVCDSDIDVGECGGTFMRYAFDRATNECRQFKYGGCGGNGNNFASMADCKLKCLKKKGANAKSALASQQALPTNICEHEVDSGECTGLFNRYAYDSSTNECRAFNYGGCGGNGNNFANVEDCRTACVKVKCAPEPECDASRCQLVRDAHGCPFCSCPPVPRHPPFNRALSTAAPSRIQCPAFELNACTEPCIVFTNRVGCRECVCPVLPSSPASSAPSSHCAPFEMSACATPCVVFTNRGGCHECVCPVNPDILPREKPGNDRDTSAPDLPPSRAPSTQSRSTRPQSPVTSAPPPLGAFGSKNNNEIDDIPPPSPVAFGELGEKCTQPLDPGPCDRFVTRWHFNLVRAECEPFQYGGCAGNRNHFFTQTECMVHCGRFLRNQGHGPQEVTEVSLTDIQKQQSTSELPIPHRSQFPAQFTIQPQPTTTLPPPPERLDTFVPLRTRPPPTLPPVQPALQQFVPPQPKQLFVPVKPIPQFVPVQSSSQFVSPQTPPQFIPVEPAPQFVPPQPASQFVPPHPASQLVPPHPAPQFVPPQPAPQFVLPQQPVTTSTIPPPLPTSPSLSSLPRTLPSLAPILQPIASSSRAPLSTAVFRTVMPAETKIVELSTKMDEPDMNVHLESRIRGPETPVDVDTPSAPSSSSSSSSEAPHRPLTLKIQPIQPSSTQAPSTIVSITASEPTSESVTLIVETTSQQANIASSPPTSSFTAPVQTPPKPTTTISTSTIEVKPSNSLPSFAPPQTTNAPQPSVASETTPRLEMKPPSIVGIEVRPPAFRPFSETQPLPPASPLPRVPPPVPAPPAPPAASVSEVDARAFAQPNVVPPTSTLLPPPRPPVPHKSQMEWLYPPSATRTSPDAETTTQTVLTAKPSEIVVSPPFAPPRTKNALQPSVASETMPRLEMKPPSMIGIEVRQPAFRPFSETQPLPPASQLRPLPRVPPPVPAPPAPPAASVSEVDARAFAQPNVVPPTSTLLPPPRPPVPHKSQMEWLYPPGATRTSPDAETTTQTVLTAKPSEIVVSSPAPIPKKQIKTQTLEIISENNAPKASVEQPAAAALYDKTVVESVKDAKAYASGQSKLTASRIQIQQIDANAAPTVKSSTRNAEATTTTLDAANNANSEFVTRKIIALSPNMMAQSNEEEQEEKPDQGIEGLMPREQTLFAPNPTTTVTQQSISQSVNTEGTQRPAQPSQPTARPVLQAITTTTLASIDDTCLLPPESGPCTNYVPRWFFNAQTAKCEMFSYGSCNGNTNNFMTRDECEKRCQIEIDQFTAQLPERCTRPRSEGVGSGYFPKWYYNQKNMRCEQFVYLGTGGNDNRFSNFADCELFCKFSKNIDENTKRVKEAEFSIPPPSPAQIVEKTTVAPTTHEEPRFFAPKFTPKPILSFKGSKSISAEVEQSGERRHSGEQQPNDIFGVVNAKTNDGDKSNNIAQPIEEEVELTAEKPRYPQDRIETNAESPHGKLPIIAPSIKSGINYQTGQSVGGKEAENDVTNPRAFGLSSHVPTKNDETQNFDKIPDASKSVFDSTGESAEEIKVPICPNGLNAMRYADGRPVMCLPGRNQCPNKSVCYFNGIDYFCCPNEDDPYDKHVFGGYDGEEVKHGYKDYPAQLSIRSIRRSRRDAAMLPPPISFSLDQVQSSLRFDDKPVHRISSAGLLERVSPCLEEMQRGSCNGALHRFFYDIHNDQCRLFYYSGCGGNTNNFVTKEDCTQRCKIGSVLMSNRNSLSDSIGSVIAAATVTESSTLLALGQCPNGETPLGDAAPVLCGNRTDSIGCPVGFYCRMGPPDICCPTAVGEEERIDIHQVLQAQRGDVRRKPFVSGAGAVDHEHAHSEQAHGVSTHDAKYNTDEDASAPANADQSAAGEQEIAHVSSHNGVPSTMCPDGSDSLLAANGAAIQCGTGSDGHELCPSGYYCSIDLERNGRLCCPLAIQGSNLPAPGAIAPYFGHRGTNPGEVIERGSLPTDPKPPKLVTPPSRHRQQTAIRPMDYDDERSHPSPNNNAHVASVHEGISANEVPPAVMPQASGTEYDHLILRSSTASLAKATETYKLNRFENAAIKGEFGNDDPFDSDRGQARESKTGPDFKVKTCLQPPSDGRACQMGEASPRSNLQFFYSEQDHVCKVFFYRGCGGNANRFETKRECEQYCGVVKA